MQSRFRWIILFLAAMGLMHASPQSAHAQAIIDFDFVELGPPGGEIRAWKDVNEAGVVAGHAQRGRAGGLAVPFAR